MSFINAKSFTATIAPFQAMNVPARASLLAELDVRMALKAGNGPQAKPEIGFEIPEHLFSTDVARLRAAAKTCGAR